MSTIERTFSFTVKLPHQAYAKLLSESRKREKLSAAVPSRTARQLIIERLDELTATKAAPRITESDKPETTRKTKRGTGEETENLADSLGME